MVSKIYFDAESILTCVLDLAGALEEEDPTDILSERPADSDYYPYRNKIVSTYQCFIVLLSSRATIMNYIVFVEPFLSLVEQTINTLP